MVDLDFVFAKYGPLPYPTGMEKAIIGVANGCGIEPRLILDGEVCIDILSESMSCDDAIDWFDRNTAGSYIGENTPLFLDRMEWKNNV